MIPTSIISILLFFFFFFNDTATTEIYTLSLHDALPIWSLLLDVRLRTSEFLVFLVALEGVEIQEIQKDRKSTRLNSSHANISYAVFCLKKKQNSSVDAARRFPNISRHAAAQANR